MVARIYRPAKTATQSGKANKGQWVLDFSPQSPKTVDPLTGTTTSRDMSSQIRLKFPTKQQAIAYGEHNGIAYEVIDPQESVVRHTAYGDNFRYNRYIAWTH